MSNDFNNIEYATWLESALKELITFPVEGICIHAISEDGMVYSNYHNIPVADKITIAGFIQQDAMIDTLRANGLIESNDEEEADPDGEET